MGNYKRTAEFPAQVDTDHIIQWVKDNLHPTDVFSDADLREAVRDDNDPEDVFPFSTLQDWALKAGFIQE